MSDTSGIDARLQDAIVRIRLNIPPLNVLGVEQLHALADRIEAADAEPSARAILLEAAGADFCAGVDVADHLPKRVAAMLEALSRLFGLLENTKLPTIATVRGRALGGGCELCLAVDCCLAADDATFGQPEIRLGVFAPPASALLPRIVGERRALEMLLGGRTIDAATALQWGLVNAVFPAIELAEATDRWVSGITAHSRTALVHAKRAVRIGRERGSKPPLEALHRLYADELMRTADATEGLQAFLQKRPARWRHQ